MVAETVEKAEKAEKAKNVRNKYHLIFMVLLIIKCCILYVFCAEFISIYTQKKYDCINFDMDNWYDVRFYFVLAGSLLAIGIFLDLIVIITSLFSVRATVVLICISLFFHSVVIFPQHTTGIIMAVKMRAPIPDDGCTVIFKPNQTEIREHSSTTTGPPKTSDPNATTNPATSPSAAPTATPDPSAASSSPTDVYKHNNSILLIGTFTQEVKYPERMLYRVLLTFSIVICVIELIYFIVSVMFGLFLLWKPMPNLNDLVNNAHAASPSNTFRLGTTNDPTNNSVFTSSTPKSKKAEVKLQP